MNSTIRRCAILILGAGLLTTALPQRGGEGLPGPAQTRLPNGKLQSDEILKAEHEANLKDAAELADLTEQLKIDLEKNDRYVLSMATIKKTDEIEKLAKRIRSRLRRN
jgi:hypothetical protein